MKSLTKSLMLTAFAFAAAFAFLTITTARVHADDGEDHGEEVTVQNEEGQEEQTENSATWTFTAQSGDSYTKIARKTVQIYGIENGVNLSGAEIVAAETWLTQDAGSPVLNEGQEVSIEASAVEAAVNRAQEMSDEAEALWAPYAALVNFDTSAVGEARE